MLIPELAGFEIQAQTQADSILVDLPLDATNANIWAAVRPIDSSVIFNSVFGNTFKSTNRLLQMQANNYWRRYIKNKQASDSSVNFENNYAQTICGSTVRNMVDFTSAIGAGGEDRPFDADGITCSAVQCTLNKFSTGGMGFYLNAVSGACEYRVVLGYLTSLTSDPPSFSSQFSWPIDNW